MEKNTDKSTDQFKDMGLSPNLLKVMKDINFSKPTEIQEKVIPLALAGHDVIGESATGSGKTLAFGIPIIEKVKVAGGLQALVLVPTRELAEQVSKSIRSISKYNPVRIITVYGGVAIGPQIDGLERAEVVVGTPGRILDHISRKTIDLSKIKILVLDEADRMFDMGFIHDVTDIVHLCPKSRQSLLFSATMSEEMAKISKRYMVDAKEVSAEKEVDPKKLEQVFYDVPSNKKFSLLVHLLKEESSKLVMIFCNTKRNADLISNNLRNQGFEAMALHGDLNQAKRTRVLDQFHRSTKFILVCTDVAARGLDIKGVSHVYNYDFPKTEEEYTHRIGRTARAGKDGKAITVLSDRDYDNFRKATRYDSLNIKKIELPHFETVFVQMNDRNERSGGQGGRFSGRSNFRRGFSNHNRGSRSRDTRSSYGRSTPSREGNRSGGSNYSRGRSSGSSGYGRPTQGTSRYSASSSGEASSEGSSYRQSNSGSGGSNYNRGRSSSNFSQASGRSFSAGGRGGVGGRSFKSGGSRGRSGGSRKPSQRDNTRGSSFGANNRSRRRY